MFLLAILLEKRYGIILALLCFHAVNVYLCFFVPFLIELAIFVTGHHYGCLQLNSYKGDQKRMLGMILLKSFKWNAPIQKSGQWKKWNNLKTVASKDIALHRKSLAGAGIVII